MSSKPAPVVALVRRDGYQPVPVSDLMRLDRTQMVELVQRLQSQVIVRQTADGPMQAAVRMVGLALGTDMLQLESAKGEPLGPPFITAAGYYRLANVMGFSVVTAPFVMVDGERRANPHFVRDPRTGAIEAVYVRKIVVGRNEAGTLVARDQTVIFQPWMYLVEDLHSKERWAPEDIRGYTMDPAAEPPEGFAFIAEVFPPGSKRAIGTLVRVASKDVRTILKTYTQRLKKSIEIAQTFADRNALKKALGIATPTIVDGIGWVPVTAWQVADEDFKRLNRAVADMRDVTELAQLGVEVHSDVAELRHEDAAEAEAEADVVEPGEDPPEVAAEVRARVAEARVPGTPPPEPLEDEEPEEEEEEDDQPDPSPDAAAPDPADIHARGLRFEDGPPTWMAWMRERGDAYRATLGDAAFVAICAGLDTGADAFYRRGRSVLAQVIEACEEEVARCA